MYGFPNKGEPARLSRKGEVFLETVDGLRGLGEQDASGAPRSPWGLPRPAVATEPGRAMPQGSSSSDTVTPFAWAIAEVMPLGR